MSTECLHDLTREKWLVTASEAILPRLQAAGAGPTPRYRVSVGWPLGVRPKNTGPVKRVGECFCSSCSKDGTHEIFISPFLDEAGGRQGVLATLLHELVHAFVGIKARHGRDFKAVAVKVGLEGKMTATAAGPELLLWLDDLAKALGPYPHASLGLGGERLRPKQGTRMIKVVCPACRYQVRTTQKWLDVGLPTCPCGQEMNTEDRESEETDE